MQMGANKRAIREEENTHLNEWVLFMCLLLPELAYQKKKLNEKNGKKILYIVVTSHR